MNKISTIRSALGITGEMDARSFPYRRQGKTHGSSCCPHCGEGSKHSNKLNVFIGHDGVEHYKCMACGKHGDVIDFVMAADGRSQKDAIDLLARKAGWSSPSPAGGSTPRPAPKRERAAEAPRTAVQAAPAATGAGDQAKSDPASEALEEAVALIRAHCTDRMTLKYLTGRGLSVATVESAVAAGAIRALPGDPTRAREMLLDVIGKDRLVASGLMRQDASWPAAAFMPLVGLPPGQGAVQFRRILPTRREGDPRYVIYGSVRWPFALPGPARGQAERPRVIAIVEGLIDALSYSECPEAAMVDTILGIPGSSAWKPSWIAAIEKRLGPDGTLVLALDDNNAGDTCSQAILEFARQSHATMNVVRVRPPTQDWNRTLQRRKEVHS